MKKTRNFTLVEITMAIAVIGIGMAGVMALLPIGFNASRDSMADNYSSDMADQFLHIIAQQAQQSPSTWNTWISSTGAGGKIDDSKPSPSDIFAATKNNQVLGNIWDTDKAGVFYVESKTGTIKDFSANIAVWKSEPRIAIYDSGNWTDTGFSYNKTAAINMEISWPTEKPYKNREKRYYYLELFCPKN